MAEGRRRDQWDHTSNLLAFIHNAVHKQAKPAHAFHPFGKQRTEQAAVVKVKMSEFRNIFMGAVDVIPPRQHVEGQPIIGRDPTPKAGPKRSEGAI